jgi:hypothetical protein
MKDLEMGEQATSVPCRIQALLLAYDGTPTYD